MKFANPVLRNKLGPIINESLYQLGLINRPDVKKIVYCINLLYFKTGKCLPVFSYHRFDEDKLEDALTLNILENISQIKDQM